MRLVQGGRDWNGLVPHIHVADKNQKGYFSCKAHSEKQRILQSRVPEPERQVPITSSYKDLEEIVAE